MTRSTEDRLTAALEARAQLVTPEDLGPLEVPSPARSRPSTGTVLMAVAASAAAAAAVSLPFVLDGGDPTRDPGPLTPTITSSSSPRPTGTEVPEPTGTDRPGPTGAPDPTGTADPTGTPAAVETSIRADLDGDGTDDDVRLVMTTDADDYGTGVVRATLSSGGSGEAAVPEGYAPTVRTSSAIGGGSGEQVLLEHTAGGDSLSLLVYTWTDDELVLARIDGDAPLALELDGQGRVADWLLGERGLMSWVRAGDPDEDGIAPVDQWTWVLDGDRLVPTPAEASCVLVTSDDQEPRECR